MGRHAKFTESQAFAVMDELDADRTRRVTVRAVRNALGGGSATTISRYIRAWRANKKQYCVAETALSDGLQQTVERAVEGIWRDLESAIRAEEAERRDELAAALLELRSLRRANAELRSQNGKLRAKLKNLESRP